MKQLKLLPIILLMFTLSSCALFHRSPPPPMAALTTFTPTLTVKQAWSTRVGDSLKKQYLTLTPIVVDNVIYTADYTGRLTATNASNGRRIWQVNTKQPLTTGLAAGNGMLFVGTGSGQILAYALNNGAFIWNAPLSSEVLATPTVAGNKLLVKSEDDHLYALNIQNGQTLWSYTEQTPDLILREGNSPQVSGNNVVVGFADGQLGVFSLETGNILWKRPIANPQGVTTVERMIDIDNTIMVQGNVIYVATYQGIIAALNITTGNIIWQHDISSYAGLVLQNNAVYVVDANSHVWAFDQRTGNILWKQDNLFGRYLTGPTLMGNAIVVGDAEGFVHWLSLQDGHFEARAAVDKSGIVARPVVVGNTVYIYSNDGRLVRFVVM